MPWWGIRRASLTVDSLLITFQTALIWNFLIAYLMSGRINCFIPTPSLKPLTMSQASPVETFVILLECGPCICFLAFQPVQQRFCYGTWWLRSEKLNCFFAMFCEVWAFFHIVQKGGSRCLGFHSYQCYGRHSVAQKVLFLKFNDIYIFCKPNIWTKHHPEWLSLPFAFIPTGVLRLRSLQAQDKGLPASTAHPEGDPFTCGHHWAE